MSEETEGIVRNQKQPSAMIHITRTQTLSENTLRIIHSLRALMLQSEFFSLSL